MGDYIKISDIEDYLHISFDCDTIPTKEQIEKYIDLAEKDFESSVGAYKETVITDELYDGTLDNIYVKNLPLVSIQSIYINDNDEFNPSYTELKGSTEDYPEYLITNPNIGQIKLKYPYRGINRYKVSYTSGYTYANMPELIKELIIVMTLKRTFMNTLFQDFGSAYDGQIIIDTETYKEVTSGGSAYKGYGDINNIINDLKGQVKSKLKTYLL